MVRLGEVATYVNGYAFKPSDWATEGMPIIRIQDLTGSSYKTNYYNGEIAEKYKVVAGDVLISWSASLGIFVWDKQDAVLNQHIFKVVFNKTDVDKRFFVHQVKNILSKAESETHGATMKHLTKPVFDALEFYLPHKEEQLKIARLLDKIEKMMENRKQQLQILDELVKARFVEMFGNPISNSRRLTELPLSELGELGRGVSKHRPRNAPELLGGEYPLIQTGDVANAELYIESFNSTYSELGLKQSKMWKAGTLCITIAANIAKTAVLKFDACFPDSVVGFNSYSNTNNIFMHYWFSFFQSILEAQAPESAQKNINLKILGELKVIVPPIEEQDNFANFVHQIDKSKLSVQKSLDKLEILKKALVQKYFG